MYDFFEINTNTNSRLGDLMCIKIALCDDEEIVITTVRERLNKLFMSCDKNYQYEIDAYTKWQDFLQSTVRYNIAFIDVEMPGKDGFEVAKELNAISPSTLIIFLTSHQSLAHKAFHVNAYRYLLKPIDNHMFREAVLSAVEEITSIRGFTVKIGNTNHVIHNIDITHITTIDGGAYLHKTDGDKLFIAMSLSKIEKSLPSSAFFRIDNKHIVNLIYLSDFDHNHAYLLDDVTLKISKRRYPALKKAIDYYLRTRG